MERLAVRCRACGTPNPDGKRFCGDCGARLPIWCPFCAAESPGGKRFCADCGQPLPGWCPSCGNEIPVGKPFCTGCGTPANQIASPSQPAPVRGFDPISPIPRPPGSGEERRLVTALFSDLAGFTPLSERLDAEEVREIQTRYFETMSAEIVRFGGKVEKFAGDAVFALFGIPAAHEDDAERAVRCALAMQAALQPLSGDVARRWHVELALRIGVNTGEAVSAAGDVDTINVAAATGDVVNTAARLQTAADAGGVMVGLETMRLTRRVVEYADRQELTLKGKAGTVTAYAVQGLRERLVERWEVDRRRVPLVGREPEMERISSAWSRARQGEGQLIALVADAGVGKSRLLAEAVERIAEQGDVRELRGRCLSHGRDISMGLVADLLRSVAGIREQDEPARMTINLVSVVDELLHDQTREMRSAAVDVLGEVLGLPIGSSIVAGAGAQARRQMLVRTLKHILVTLCNRQPTVLVLEDLHWADAASSDVLSDVLQVVPELKLFVLAAQRPGWVAPWSDWSFAERLNLRPLDEQQAVSLAAAVLGEVPLAPELQEYVADRAGGNPFYIEELLQSLQETGGLTEHGGSMHIDPAAAGRLPTTLTELLLARLDRLDASVRGLVQVASVIGRTFGVDLLSSVLGQSPEQLEPSLDALPRAEIAFPRQGLRSEYIFKHVTVRDVAYNTLLQRRRQEFHASVARAIQMLYPGDEYVEIVAYHLSRTDDHAEAAAWLERAGDRARDMYANRAAIGHYEECRRRLELSGADELAFARIAEKLGGMFRVTAWYDEALEELEQAAEIYRVMRDRDAEARAAAQIGQVHFARGARDESIRGIRQVLKRVHSHEEDAQTVGAGALRLSLVEPLCDEHRFDEALADVDAVLRIAESTRDPRLRVRAETVRIRALQGLGRLDEATRTGTAAVAAADESGDLESLAQGLMWLGEVTLSQGDPAEARDLYERALAVQEMRGDLGGTAQLLGKIGQTFVVLGDWQQALSYFERAVELVRSMSFAHFSASSLLALGEHYLRLGETDKAQRYLEEPFTIAESSGHRDDIPYLQIPLADWDLFSGAPERALGRLATLLKHPKLATADDHRALQIASEAALAVGDVAMAERLVDEGTERAQRTGNRLALADWLRVKGLLATRDGQFADATSSLREAVTLCHAIDYPYCEARSQLHLAQVQNLAGEPAQALESLTAAVDVFRRLGARPYLERVEQMAAEDHRVLG